MTRVFIEDIEQLREFIKLHKRKEEYFNHVMDELMAKKGMR